MTTVNISIDEEKLRELVLNYLAGQLGIDLNKDDVKIQVKSKQNYKSEWEAAEFKAIVNKMIV